MLQVERSDGQSESLEERCVRVLNGTWTDENADIGFRIFVLSLAQILEDRKDREGLRSRAKGARTEGNYSGRLDLEDRVIRVTYRRGLNATIFSSWQMAVDYIGDCEGEEGRIEREIYSYSAKTGRLKYDVIFTGRMFHDGQIEAHLFDLPSRVVREGCVRVWNGYRGDCGLQGEELLPVEAPSE